MNNRFRNTGIGQQMALTAAGLCLLVSLALVALSAISSKHLQMEVQQEYGSALAQFIARGVSNAIQGGDLLSVSASLQRFVEISMAEQVTVTDVEGKTIGQSGRTQGLSLYQYTAPVLVESDIAGEVTISISAQSTEAAQLRFTASLVGLAVLLSLGVYFGTRHWGQRLGSRLSSLARVVALEEEDPRAAPKNEIALLEKQIDALPMDLLRTRSEPGPRDENYETTAILYLGLISLADYVDTLDEQSLHSYTDRLHQMVYAASGFYAGDIQVARQFGIAIYFSGNNSAGSAAFRAASCGWLIGSASRALEQQMSLSLNFAMAISQSELGVGDGDDIYPGLYMQHTLDELQSVCASKPPNILLSPAATADVDVAGRLQFRPTDIADYAVIEEFAGPYKDLLERQLRLILQRLMDTGRR